MAAKATTTSGPKPVKARGMSAGTAAAVTVAATRTPSRPTAPSRPPIPSVGALAPSRLPKRRSTPSSLKAPAPAPRSRPQAPGHTRAPAGSAPPFSRHKTRAGHDGLSASGGFQSKAQWRYAFATHKPWARKAAHASRPFKSLPSRKGGPSLRSVR